MVGVYGHVARDTSEPKAVCRSCIGVIPRSDAAVVGVELPIESINDSMASGMGSISPKMPGT